MSTSSPEDHPHAGRFHSRPIDGYLPGPNELGPAADIPQEAVLSALSLARTGEMYDLDTGRWVGMEVPSTEPPYQVLTYRSPRGERVQNDYPNWTGTPVQMGWLGDLVVTGTHIGTHIDALSHITSGERDQWYGGHSADEFLGDFGPLVADASAIPPIITRGVLIDVAGALGKDILPAGYIITPDDLQAALSRQGNDVQRFDTVMVRTGYTRAWNTPTQDEHTGAGIGIDAAQWLVEQGAVALGADTEAVEAVPSGDATNPHPVHIRCLGQWGVHLIEMLYLEELARDRVYNFLFVCLPPRLRGATGSFVRPIAIR